MAAATAPIGYLWLRENFRLDYPLTHQSFLGTRPRLEIEDTGNVLETYPPTYGVEETALSHVEFGLKYDDLNLDFLGAAFDKVPVEEVVSYIHSKPRGSYQRRIGFLYEFLSGIRLPVEDTAKTNYVDLVDPEKYLTGKVEKASRWRINNNLLGTPEFCPVIR